MGDPFTEWGAHWRLLPGLSSRPEPRNATRHVRANRHGRPTQTKQPPGNPGRFSWRMSPVGWEALRLWGEDADRIERLAGGVANDVWSVRVRGKLAVGRLGSRSDADLAWEAGLLQHLDRQGLAVPVPIPAIDGRLFAGGLMVMTFMEGGPPRTENDWRRVADTLRELHRVTQGWPQRPGWRSSTDLLNVDTGTRIDLRVCPIVCVRALWPCCGLSALRPQSDHRTGWQTAP